MSARWLARVAFHFTERRIEKEEKKRTQPILFSSFFALASSVCYAVWCARRVHHIIVHAHSINYINTLFICVFLQTSPAQCDVVWDCVYLQCWHGICTFVCQRAMCAATPYVIATAQVHRKNNEQKWWHDFAFRLFPITFFPSSVLLSVRLCASIWYDLSFVLSFPPPTPPPHPPAPPSLHHFYFRLCFRLFAFLCFDVSLMGFERTYWHVRSVLYLIHATNHAIHRYTHIDALLGYVFVSPRPHRHHKRVCMRPTGRPCVCVCVSPSLPECCIAFSSN